RHDHIGIFVPMPTCLRTGREAPFRDAHPLIVDLQAWNRGGMLLLHFTPRGNNSCLSSNANFCLSSGSANPLLEPRGTPAGQKGSKSDDDTDTTAGAGRRRSFCRNRPSAAP